MAQKCQSWRYHPHSKHPTPPAPGECRRCWTTCNKIAPAHSNRCDQCFELLITNPNPEVRRAIALEPNATDSALARLSEDYDYSVALSAMNVLEQRRRAAVAVGVTGGPTSFRGQTAPAGLPWALN